MKKGFRMSLILSVLFFLFNWVFAQQPKVYVYKIHEEIAPPAVKTTRDALKKADSLQCDLIILHLDTYGGMVDAADEIRTLILNSSIPVWVFIENNAASAGAFIAIACDSIFMKPGSTIGASTVVNQQGEKVGEKYQSFMRSRMRSTAEQNGRNPDIAEAMVEAQKTIPGVVDSGKVVSLTVKEAIQLGFCEGEFSSIQAIFDYYGLKPVEIIYHKETVLSSIIRFFMKPAISGLLITIIVLAIFFELKTPGVGIPTAVAILAAILYFVPLYLEGLAANWEIILFIIGLILLMLEIFVIPGFGVAGILGGLCIFFSLVFALVKAVPDTGPLPLPDTDSLLKAVLTVIISILGAFGLIVLFGRSVMHSGFFHKVEVATTESKQEGWVALPVLDHSLIGKQGVAISTLRPVGNIEIDNEVYEASVPVGYIDKGEAVVVTGIDNSVLIVKKLN
ncbi:MAG: nodulation protein NfeD [Flavobacteriales bacterium]|nr:nodulation protein NfeD [Flavobacteriales bacterium]